MRLQRYLKIDVLIVLLLLVINSSSAQIAQGYTNDSLMSWIDNGMSTTIRYRPKDTAGAIGLPFRYSSPCSRNSDMFSELYYWDAFFVNRYYWLPKVKSGNTEAFEIAIGNVNNLIYLVNKYGFVPNANRFSMLNRSQLPLLSEMVKDIFEFSGDVNWLQKAVDALEKEHQFWMQNRAVQLKIRGKYITLNRFGNQATPEQLMGFYNFLKQRLKPNPNQWNANNRKSLVPSSLFEPGNNSEMNQLTRDSILNFASHLLAEAESGWDFTPRFQGRCMDFVPVDLNAVLGAMERNMASFYRALQTFETDTYRSDIQKFRISYYLNTSKLRRLAMDKYLWNEKRGCYMDYNWKQTDVGQPLLTAVSFWPVYLKWGRESSTKSVQRMLGSLIFKDAVMPLDIKAVKPMPYVCQWNVPNVWAPIQILVWESIQNQPLGDDFWLQSAIKNCWLNLVVSEWHREGKLKEKYSIVTSESILLELNQLQGADDFQMNLNGFTIAEEGYGTPSMMGWTAAITFFLLQTK